MTPFTQQDIDRLTLPAYARSFLEVDGLAQREAQFIEVSNRVSKLQTAINRPYKPNPPRARPIDPHWEVMGQQFGMDPHEVKIILEHVLQNPNETVLPALRQLLIVGKLQCTDGISKHRQGITEEKRHYEERLAKYEQELITVEPNIQQLEALKRERHEIYRELWDNLVNQLETSCIIADHRMNRLCPAAFSAMTILERNSKYVVYDKTDPTDWLIVVQWDFLYKFKAPHVDTILGFFKKVGLLNGIQRSHTHRISETGDAPQSVDDHTPGQPQDPQQPEQPDELAQLPDALGHSV